MTEESKMILADATEHMEMAIVHLNKNLITIRTGKASPKMLLGVKVDYYGTATPLDQVANINVPEPRQIVIQPWEKNMIHPIMKEIQSANLGFNPQDDGDIIRIIVPELTEERRKDLAKSCKAEGEKARVAVRAIRQKGNAGAKDLLKEGISEDEEKQLTEEIQKITNNFIKEIDEIVGEKEKEIMAI